MAYDTRFDPVVDYSLDRTTSFSRHMLRGDIGFGSATSPTMEEVELFLDARVGEVVVCLAQAGYSTTQPVATIGTPAARWLSNGVVWGAMVDIELSRPTTGVGAAEPNARFVHFDSQWKAFKEALAGATLEQLGGTRDRYASDGLKFVGGSWDEQEEIHDDEDRKNALFPRGYLDPEDRRAADPDADEGT